jgi:hypothetical protein
MKVQLPNLTHWLDEQDGVTPEEIVRRVVERACRTKMNSLGQNWAKFQELYDILGPDEFEVFIQCNVDHHKKAIAERGFYPSILLTAEATDIYEARRLELLKMWANPSTRYRSEYFTAMLPDEMNLMQELLARLLKRYATNPSLREDAIALKEAVNSSYEQAVLEVQGTASGYWLLSNFTFEECQNLYDSATTQFKAIALARAKTITPVANRSLRKDYLRVQCEACTVWAGRLTGNHPERIEVWPEYCFPPGRTDKWILDMEELKILNLEEPTPPRGVLAREVARQLLMTVPPGKASSFNFNGL